MDENPGYRTGPNGGGRLIPPWTPEQQLEAARKGGRAKKAYSLRGALARKLKARRADGTRPWDSALDAFVEKLLSGDVRAIELAMESVDGPQPIKREVTHGISRDLLIRPDGDLRGVESVPVLPASSVQSQLDNVAPDTEPPQVQ